MAAIIAAGIGAAGAIGGGLIGGSASKKAASTQASANTQAAQLAYSMYQQTAARLQPWVSTGQAANQQIGGLLGLPGMGTGPGGAQVAPYQASTPFPQVPSFTPFQPTMAQLEQTPGFQFTLQQGERAVTNAGSAMGLTGNTLAGAGSYATGLASQTLGQQQQIYMQNAQQQQATYLNQAQNWQQQFSNYWSQLGNIYNLLSGTSAQGANAAAGVGQAGGQAAVTAGNFLSGAGTASAAGTIGAAGATTNALGGVASAAAQPFQLAYLQSIMGGAGGGANVPGPPGGGLFGTSLFAPASTYTGGGFGQAINNPGSGGTATY